MTQGIIYEEDFEDAFANNPGLDNHQAPPATAMHLNVKAVHNQRAAIINRPEFRERTSMLSADKESSSLNVGWRRGEPRALQGPESTHGASSTTAIGRADLVSAKNASNGLEGLARSNTSSTSLGGEGVGAGMMPTFHRGPPVNR